MSSILKKLQDRSKASAIDFVDLGDVDCSINFTSPLDITQVLNSRVEEFITLTYFNNRLFVLGFIGRTCIMKETAVSTERNVGDKCFSFSVKRDFLKILDKKEELKFELKDGFIRWTFKYGDGMILRKMRPSGSIYEIKRYLDFILNLELTNSEGTVDGLDIRSIHKKIEKLETDNMARNVIIGQGYTFTILPSYAIFKSSNTTSNTLLTESIISNLPKKPEEFEIKVSQGFTSLIGKTTGICYIYPTITTRDSIEAYSKLPIKWMGEMRGLHRAIKVVTFGDKNTEVQLRFEEGDQTVLISELDNDNNKFIGRTPVMAGGSITISSIIQEFGDLVNIGVVSEAGREHIKALSFEGGEICLLR